MSDEPMGVREALAKAFAETPSEPEEVVSHETTSDEPQADLAVTDDHPPSIDRARDELGRFAPKDASLDTVPDPAPVAEQQPAPVIPDEFSEPPSRFSAEARAAFKDVPAPVRQEMQRAFKELEGGIQQYREQLAPYQPFLEAAKRSGVDPVALVSKYTEIDRVFTANPLQGFDLIARSLGTDMRTIAAHIMGQPAPERDATVTQLQHQNAEMMRELQQLRGVSQRYQTEQQGRIEQTVTQFAASHPRFEELAPAIQGILKAGLAPDLPTAYAYAERLNPAPAPATTAQTSVAPPPAAPQKHVPVSIKGAPSSGSNPGNAPSMSTRDALKRAFAEIGPR